MQNLPLELSKHKLMVTEEPAIVTFTNKETGEVTTKTVYGTEDPVYAVSVFMKGPANPETGRRPKGAEVKIEFTNPPEDDIDEGMYISAINPTVSLTNFVPKGKEEKDRIVDWKFRAAGITGRTS